MKTDTIGLIVGSCMLLLGIACRVYVSRNRFYRRGVAGLQQFSSYRKSVVVTAFEGIVKIVGTLLILGGLLLFLLFWFDGKQSTIQDTIRNVDTAHASSPPKHKKHGHKRY